MLQQLSFFGQVLNPYAYTKLAKPKEATDKIKDFGSLLKAVLRTNTLAKREIERAGGDSREVSEADRLDMTSLRSCAKLF